MDNVKKQTLLCVDDDQTNRELLGVLLSNLGYQLKFAESGEEALAQIEAEIPDLILLDVMMPRLSGFEVLARLRAAEKTRFVPVILLTALGSGEDRIRGIEAGCDDFISKPFDKSELIVRIRSLLRMSYYRDALEEKEKLWEAVHEMSQPLIFCKADWVITNLNRAAQRYLIPVTRFENVNLLDFLFDHYFVSVPWKELKACVSAPRMFRIEKKDPGGPAIQCAEVSLEVFENFAHEAVNLVLTLRDMAERTEKKVAPGIPGVPPEAPGRA